MTKTKNGYKISFLIVLTIVVLSFCICVGSVAAWLRVDYTRRSEGLELGTVKLELWDGSTQINGTNVSNGEVISTHATLTIPTSANVTRLLGVKVRNVGTISCLVRVQFKIYYKEYDNDEVVVLLNTTAGTTNNINYASIDHSGWIAKLPNSNVAAGELYFNSQLAPYVSTTIDDNGNITNETISNNAKNIISSITTVDSEKTRVLYMDITADAIAFSGNIYKKTEDPNYDTTDVPVEAYPFGLKSELPAGWTAYKE